MLALASPSTASAADTPVRVNACTLGSPRTTQSYYAAAYYPVNGPYYWGDPYGHTYHQYALPSSSHTTSAKLNIAYVNVTNKPLKEVEFGFVMEGLLLAEVRDQGKFSPGAEIKHTFGVNENVFHHRKGSAQCLPLRATYEDGTVWTSEHLPKLNSALYR